MFSLQIVDTDAFLEMPMSSQLLYFHLSMRADDEGFVGNPKKIMKMVGSNDDDFKVLITKRFLLVFESGVVVIKHWLIHNTIRMDRFKETTYKDEKNRLLIKENKAYTELGSGQPNGNQMETQVKLSKYNISKDNIVEQNSTSSSKSKKYDDKTPMSLVGFQEWCKGSPQRHIQVIGEWAEAEEPKYTLKGQWYEYIDRNLRPARALVAYSQDQLQEAFDRIQKDIIHVDKETGKRVGFLTKYTLETLRKYL